MKIMTVNKYYFLKGGTERYLFDSEKLLSAHGHQVVPFAMQDEKNKPATTTEFFAPSMQTERVEKTVKGIGDAARLLYSVPAKRCMERLLQAEHPHIAHVHNLYHQLSTSVLDAMRSAHIPAVMTVHDYRLLTPNYSLFHDGAPCNRGINNPFAIIPHRCIKQSYAASTLLAVESAVVRVRKTYQKSIARFIFPSHSAYRIFAQAGWNMENTVVIPHFLDLGTPEFANPAIGTGDGVICMGRFSEEKGFDVVIRAARELPHVQFTLIGTGPMETALKAQSQGMPNIRFTGWLAPADVAKHVRGAAIVVVPSLHPEIFGYTALESMAHGKVTIVSRIGALPEIIEHQKTGLVFSPGNHRELAACIGSAVSDSNLRQTLGQSAREVVASEYTPEKHFARLMEIYSDAMTARHAKD